jgi:hypothetical protein
MPLFLKDWDLCLVPYTQSFGFLELSFDSVSVDVYSIDCLVSTAIFIS